MFLLITATSYCCLEDSVSPPIHMTSPTSFYLLAGSFSRRPQHASMLILSSPRPWARPHRRPCYCSKQLCSIRPKTKAVIPSTVAESLQWWVAACSPLSIYLPFYREELIACEWNIFIFQLFFKRQPQIPTKTPGSYLGNTFYNKLYHILFYHCQTMLCNLLFSAVHHRATSWHSISLWPRHKWWGDHVDCTLTITPIRPSVAICSVYCPRCWLIAALWVFTVVELTPALLTEPSGLQTSANQPLVSTQFVGCWSGAEDSFLPSSLSPVPLRGQNECLNGMHLIHFKCFVFPSLNLHLFFTVSY